MYFDDNAPEYIAGIIRCGSVISFDENGKELNNHQDLIDNTEFRSQAEMINYVAAELHVCSNSVVVVD